MKSLAQMDNLDKGLLLCKLFPDQLQHIQNYIQEQCSYFTRNESVFREGWQPQGFLTADFWYGIMREVFKVVNKDKIPLWKRPHWFADYLFDGYNSLFTQYCLIELADTDSCNYQLKQAIHLLFGYDKLIAIHKPKKSRS